MPEALFESAHEALTFAFRQRLQILDRAPLNRVAAPAAGSGRPPAEIKHEGRHITLPPWAVTMLRKLGDGSISRGIVAALERIKREE